LTKSRELIQNN